MRHGPRRPCAAHARACRRRRIAGRAVKPALIVMAKPEASSAPSDGGEDREILRKIARQIADADRAPVAAPVPAAPETRTQREDAGAAAGSPGVASGSADAAAALVARLIDAVPCALASCAGGTLNAANSAFALAFGYAGASELVAAGGLSAIFPNEADVALLLSPAAAGETSPHLVDALTRGRRRTKARLTVRALGSPGATPLVLLVLEPEHASAPSMPEAVRRETEADERSAAGPTAAPASKEPAEERLDAVEGPGHREATGSAWTRPDVLATVSHEIRTPLNSILGFAEIMKEERFGPIGNSRYESYMRDIHASGEYALSLINDLLDISKLEAGRFELNFTTVEINELIDECVQLMQPQAGKLRVVVRVALSDVPAVLADRRALKQILLNLLSNAVKFTQPGGQVIVSSRCKDSGAVRLRVQDTGVGMSPSEIAEAMQPFRRIDQGLATLPGTGLGLPLTEALSEANRARFKLKSKPGVGTRADVVFPAERTVAR